GRLHCLLVEAARDLDREPALVAVAGDEERALGAEQRDRLVEQQGEQRLEVAGLRERAVEGEDRGQARALVVLRALAQAVEQVGERARRRHQRAERIAVATRSRACRSAGPSPPSRATRSASRRSAPSGAPPWS